MANDPVFMYCPSLQDDSASGTITDLSPGGGYDINNTGTWVADTGAGGSTAVELNSTQSHTYNGTMPSAFASMDGGIADNGRTLSIWVKLNNFGSARTGLAIQYFSGVGSTSYGYLIGGNLSGGTAEGFAEAFATTSSTAGGSTPPSTWVHIAYTIDRDVSSNSTTTRLYVDGTFVDQDVLTVPDSSLNRIVIGARLATGGTLSDFLDGRWDDARGYDRILNDAEIANLATQRGYGGIPVGNEAAPRDLESLTELERPNIFVRNVDPRDIESVTELDRVDLSIGTSVTPLGIQSLTELERPNVVRRILTTPRDIESSTELERNNLKASVACTPLDIESTSELGRLPIGATPTAFPAGLQSATELERPNVTANTSVTVRDIESATELDRVDIDSTIPISVRDIESVTELERVEISALKAIPRNLESNTELERVRLGGGPLVSRDGFTMTNGFATPNSFK